MPLENSRGMAVWVRAEAALPIIKCTPEFVTFIGPSSVGTPLLEFVSNKSEFKSWVETCANYLIQGMRPNSPSFRVLLRFPQVAHEVRADAEITLDEEYSDDDVLSWFLIIRFRRMETISSGTSSQGSGSTGKRYKMRRPREPEIRGSCPRLSL